MNKRGALITLDEIVTFIPKFMIAMIAFFVLLTLWGTFFTEKMSAGQYDLLRVHRNMQDLASGDSFNVFTTGKDYNLVLLPKNNPEPACNNDACICVQEKTGGAYATTKCEIFTNVDCTKAPTDPRFICISSKTDITIMNPDPVHKDYVTVSRATNGATAIALNRITI